MYKNIVQIMWLAQVAEWSKAVRSGRILNWRGFESLLVHSFCFLLFFPGLIQ
jgi:hypothetical protein